MGAVVVLVALYIAAIAAVGVWATVRVVRRSGEKLGRLRTHVVIYGAVMGATAVCALAAALNHDMRPYLLGAAALLYVGARVHFAWMERHDTTDPGPPLTEVELTRLHKAALRSRQTGFATAASLVLFVPVLWIELGWPWALGFLALGASSLHANLWKLPRAYERTLRRRGVEDRVG